MDEQLRHTEERFRLLVESVIDYAIFLLDPEGRVTTWNAGAQRIKGYAAAEIIGQHFSRFYPPDAVRTGWPAHELKTAAALGRFEDEGWRVRKDGSLFWANVIITALYGPDGVLRGFAKVTRDLTERRRAEERLQAAHDALEQRVRERTAELSAANAQLREEIESRMRLERELVRTVEHLRDADRHRNEFLAILAHELRNPLAPIRNAIEFLQAAGPPDATLGQARAIIQRQVRQMGRLVDDLIDLSRVTRNTLQVRRTRAPLRPVLDDAIDTSRPTLEEMQHRLHVEVPAEPILLDLDATRMSQVFANLLNNAAKYTPRGGDVTLSVTATAEHVSIMVRDTGIGIPANNLSRVFEMFTQLENGHAWATAGLGIGLTLARRIVELHGGTIGAASDGPGLGSTFTVRLPVTPAREASSEEVWRREEVPSGETVPGGRRVLVVDDNRDGADSLAMVLSDMGANVRVAYDGLAGLHLLEVFRPEVVLLDVGMPGLDGYEVARRMRQSGPGRSVVLVATTGWGQEQDKQRARQAGFDHHLTKPVDPGLFRRILAGAPLA